MWSVEYRDRGSNRLLETPVQSVSYHIANGWIEKIRRENKNYKLGVLILVPVKKKYSSEKTKRT